jgi:hypothetical protein
MCLAHDFLIDFFDDRFDQKFFFFKDGLKGILLSNSHVLLVLMVPSKKLGRKG